MEGLACGRWRRLGVLVAVFVLIASACSGSKDASDVTERRTPGPTIRGLDDLEFDGDAAVEGEEGETETGSGSSGRTRSRATATAPVAQPGEAPTVKRDEATGRPVANLFTAEEDRVGMTDSEIRICMHAAFIFGEAFDNRPDDEKVYWQMVNDAGGIDGRQVNIRLEDDAYAADQGRAAADTCKEWGAYMILSGVGFDVIPAVREWAETNRQLYFHSMATEDGAKDKNFSFAVAPTLQTMGRQIAQFLSTNHKGKSFAVLSRNSPNWDGALDTFKAELKKRGHEVVAERRVNNGQTSYLAEITELRQECPAAECVVFANENVLNFAQIYQQAEGQGYRPRWFNYGFQLVNDTLGSGAARDPAVQAWYPTPAFDLYNEIEQPWWDEIQRMKAAYEKYRPQKEPNDVDWMFWVTFKALHRMLLDCGADCTRNALVGMLLDGYQATVDPLCEANFAEGHNHFGAWQANIYESVTHSRYGAAWKQIETCKASF